MKTEEHSFNEEHMVNKVKDTGFSGRLGITESIGQYKKKLELQVLDKEIIKLQFNRKINIKES